MSGKLLFRGRLRNWPRQFGLRFVLLLMLGGALFAGGYRTGYDRGYDARPETFADFDSLIDLITATVRPTTWEDVGGPEHAEPFGCSLTVSLDGPTGNALTDAVPDDPFAADNLDDPFAGDGDDDPFSPQQHSANDLFATP